MSEAGRKLYSVCEQKYQYDFLIQDFFPGSKGILSVLQKNKKENLADDRVQEKKKIEG